MDVGRGRRRAGAAREEQRRLGLCRLLVAGRERRIAYEVLGGQLASSEGAGFDVLDRGGGKWEVRSLTKGGIYFCPSYMVGSGRRFELQGFLSKLADIEGYIVSDITAFPSIPYWKVPVDQVREWWDRGQLGTSTKISRDTARALLRRM